MNPVVDVVDDGREVTFRHEGLELARYVYRPETEQYESPKPYVHPLRDLAGREVSLYRPHDHLWHKGISWALPNVGPHNFWGGPTYTRATSGYAGLPNNGAQVHAETVTAAEGVFSHRLDWIADPAFERPSELVFTEERSLKARVLDEGVWALDWSTRMTNRTDQTIRVGSPTTEGRENAGYGGLFWRGPRSFDDGVVLSPEGSGDAEVMRGQRHGWMGFVGKHDGVGGASTLIMIDGGAAGSGTNPGGTPMWFVRSNIYGCMCPAPFFDAEVPAPSGQELVFEYTTLIADRALDAAAAAVLVAAAR